MNADGPTRRDFLKAAASLLLPYAAVSGQISREHFRAGDIELKRTLYKSSRRRCYADVGNFYAAENWRDADGSPLIKLPVVRVYAKYANYNNPLFIVGDRQGFSGEHFESRDLVMLGNRGVDGTVSLRCPEIEEALAAEEELLSPGGMERIAEAMSTAYGRLREEGIDLDRYTLVDAVDDLEEGRKALGYEKIDLWGHGYGALVAYIYSVRYRDTAGRCFVSGAPAPGRQCAWDAELIDKQLAHYAELWKAVPACAARTTDLMGTMRSVLARLPVVWEEGARKVRIDPDRVKVMTFFNLYNTGTAEQVFDAYVAAAEGDWRGLAYICHKYRQVIPRAFVWGDFFSKLYSSSDLRFDPAAAADTVIGSPLAKLVFAPKDAWPVAPIPREYWQSRTDVETLVVNGNLDFSTPVERIEESFLPLLGRGALVTASEMGHHDIYNLQPDSYWQLCREFLFSGEVDPKFTYHELDFAPETTFQELTEPAVW